MGKKNKITEELAEETVQKNEPSHGLSVNWVWTTLKEVVHFYSGSAFPKSYQGISDEEISFYKVGSLKMIDSKYHLYKSLDSINDDTRKKLKAKLIPKNTILFAKIGEAIRLNRRAVLSEASCIDNNLMGINGKEGVLEHQFLLYWTLHQDFYQYSQATTVPSIRKSTLEGVAFPLPPVNEQKRIAEKVERLLRRIEEAKILIEEAKETFELRRAAILEKAFCGELTKEWRLKNSLAENVDALLNAIKITKEEIYTMEVEKAKLRNYKKPTRPKKFKNDIITENSPELPTTWTYCTLGDVIYDFKYGTSAKSDYEFKGMPVIRIPNIGQTKVNTGDMKFLMDDTVESGNSVQEGDILIVRSNGSKDLVGKCSLITKNEENHAFASYLIRLRPVKVMPEFILWLLKSEGIKSQFFSKAKSSAGINNINTEELATTVIPLPPISEQKEIVDKINHLIRLENESRQLLDLGEKIDGMKQAILSKAFRGELGTNDPTEESAIELLKEIVQEKIK
ncbi:restriction endonuclease subunit S [Bacillus cereus group sp. Bce009]|uniref:restriction endonuclease subunit S n=1 Tax=Bacillus cereus group sp. Bce009 TaxID=3445252 RepID=UPI003F26A7A8